MKNYQRYFYDFDTVEEHVENLAQLEARGLIGWDNFVEGYGNIKDMGIDIKIVDGTKEIVEEN